MSTLGEDEVAALLWRDGIAKALDRGECLEHTVQMYLVKAMQLAFRLGRAEALAEQGDTREVELYLASKRGTVQ